MIIDWKKICARAFLFLILIVMYLPIIVIMIFSFTESKVTGTWTGFSLGLYSNLLHDPTIMSAVRNTFLLAIVSSLLATAIGTLAAVGIFYMKKMTKGVVNIATQITVVNADIVTGVAFMLFFVVISSIGIKIPDGFATLIISHTVITVPYVILSVLPRMSQLDPNLYEAGLDLGASPIGTMTKVVVPQLIPSMIAGCALAFTLSIDDFVITKFNNGSVDTISTLIYNSSRHGIDPAFRALSTIIFVMVLVVLILINIISRRSKNNNLKLSK